jgi:acyl-CoA reductase-like NAD-dependent aldehyde dehydrogenase
LPRLINSGQSCIAAKRFVVVDSVRAEFERRLVEKMLAARVGDPMDPRVRQHQEHPDRRRVRSAVNRRNASRLASVDSSAA